MFHSIGFIMTYNVYINAIHTKPTTILCLDFFFFFWYNFIFPNVNSDLILIFICLLIIQPRNFPTDLKLPIQLNIQDNLSVPLLSSFIQSHLS